MNGDMCTRFSKHPGNGCADSAVGAGNQGAFTAEIDIHKYTLPDVLSIANSLFSLS